MQSGNKLVAIIVVIAASVLIGGRIWTEHAQKMRKMEIIQSILSTEGCKNNKETMEEILENL